MFTGKGVLGAIGPFVPVLVGIILKFSLLDKPPADLATHFKQTYLTGLWLDFIVTAYISGVVWLLTKKNHDHYLVILLFVVPAICFVVCILLTLGFAKAGVESEFLTLYLPAIIAAISVGLAGNALAVAR